MADRISLCRKPRKLCASCAIRCESEEWRLRLVCDIVCGEEIGDDVEERTKLEQNDRNRCDAVPIWNAIQIFKFPGRLPQFFSIVFKEKPKISSLILNKPCIFRDL